MSPVVAFDIRIIKTDVDRQLRRNFLRNPGCAYSGENLKKTQQAPDQGMQNSYSPIERCIRQLKKPRTSVQEGWLAWKVDTNMTD